MLRSRNKLLQELFFVLDLMLIGISVWSNRVDASLYGGQVACLCGIWFLVASRRSIYQSRRTHTIWSELRDVGEAWLLTLGLGALVAIGLNYRVAFLPVPTILIGFVLLSASRVSVRYLLRSYRFSGKNFRTVLMLGNGPAAAWVARQLDATRHFGLRITEQALFPGEDSATGHVLNGLSKTSELATLIAKGRFDLVIVCPPISACVGDVTQVFETCDAAGIKCQYSPHFHVDHLYPYTEWFAGEPTITFAARRQAPVALATKRMCDAFLSLIALVILAPVFAVIAAIIKSRDRGPVFFRQERVGKLGRPFDFYKFRTMRVGAEAQKAALMAHNEADGPVFKMHDDPRITGFGRFLRKFSLDELPQFWNVLIGDMSLVGPRPPTPDEVDHYEWSQRRRLSVRPGLTCIWQVFGRNRVSFRRWLEMDLYYIDHWSLLMDLRLMFQTVFAVCKGTGV